MTLGQQDILGLLVARLATVLAIEADEIGRESRFDEDLHADSLDLVEVIEGVERDLEGRGVAVRLPEDELLDVRTVGDAADRLHAAVARATS